MRILILCLPIWILSFSSPSSSSATQAQREELKDFCSDKSLTFVHAPPGVRCPDFFIVCTPTGDTVIKDCPPGEIFNKNDVMCGESPAECQGNPQVPQEPQIPQRPQKPSRPQKPETPQEPQKPQRPKQPIEVEPFHCPSAHGDFPSSECNATYYGCRDSVPTKIVCNLGKVFNPVIGVCDTPANVFGCGSQQCDENEIYNECGSACPPTCANPGPVPCTRQCVIGCFCVPGFVRDEHDRCISKDMCGTKPGKPSDEFKFECPEENGNFALRSNICGEQYIECEENFASLQNCGSGLTFDAAQGFCRPKSEVTECEFNCKSLENAMYGEGCSNNFWWCWNEEATKHSCPKNTFFDVGTGKCLFREEVAECTGKTRTTSAPTSSTSTERARKLCKRKTCMMSS